MPADESLLGNLTVEFRDEERRARWAVEPEPEQTERYATVPACCACGLMPWDCFCHDGPDFGDGPVGREEPA